jgi:L-lactate dehydrogenase complex protein LldG
MDMRENPGRNLILSRIRASLDCAGPNEQLDREPEHGPVPERARGSVAQLVRRFTEEAEDVAATVQRIASIEEVPDAVASYLAAENLPAALRMAPDDLLAKIPWSRTPTISTATGATDGSDDVGLTAAYAGVAETGTLVLRSGPESPTTLNFLPATHIVVLYTDQIVGAYEDALTRLRAEGPLPRTVNFITGPSRTADIEQQLELGAHGPRRLHIVLVGDLPMAEDVGNG